MPLTKDEIVAAAKALPEAERGEVIDELQATLHPEPPGGLSPDEWSAELERRWQAAEADPARANTWAEIRRLGRSTTLVRSDSPGVVSFQPRSRA